MRKSRFNEDQMVEIFREADRTLVVEVAKRHRTAEQTIYDRCSDVLRGLVHRSDRGTQHLSMSYTDRPADAGIAPSVGSRGDSHDYSLAESMIGLFQTEVIRRCGPWRHLEAVEFATLT